MRSVPFNLILCLSCWLSVSQTRLCAQAPLTGPSPVASVSATSSPRANDALVRARELYSTEGARRALPEFEKALALFRSEGDRKGEAITIGLIGNCYKRFGEFSKALEYLQRALSIKHEIGDRGEEGKTLSHLG